MHKERETMMKKKGKANEIDVYVGERLRAYRMVRGWSQEKLAKALDLTFQQIQKYERGTNRISAGRLWDICKVLEIGLLDLFPSEEANDKWLAIEVDALRNRSHKLAQIEKIVGAV